MRHRFVLVVGAAALVTIGIAVMAIPMSAAGQGQAAAARYTPSRTPEGHPDLQGVWRVWNLAKYNVEPHGPSEGVPAGLGVVVDPPDGMIPYKPWARAHQRDNYEK